jgi:uncharacterized protein (TIGR02246 family)
MLVQTPEEAVRAMVDAFNRGDLDAFMDFYEPGATLVPQPGRVASGAAAIREAMGGFLALEGLMEIEPDLTVVRASDVALVSGTWRWVIDLPFGIS